MKQLLHRHDTGAQRIVNVPVPAFSEVELLVATNISVISPGTERAVIEFGRANWIEKARSRPEQIRRVLDKVRTDGVLPTIEAVRAKLQDPIELGYCNAGVVVGCGARAARHFKVGDRVVTNGSHSEYVTVPHTLAARIPANVSDENAAFAPLCAIALQGIRVAAPTLGETVVVMGLGLIGQLTVQLLRANGCRVIGIDPHAGRRALAEQFGAVVMGAAGDDVVQRVLAETAGVGADAVLLTLSSDSNEPAHQAAAMSRKRGRVVLVGVTGLALRRDDFYKKELSFSVSCSYGPGRYDPRYEDQAIDYPLPYVRWTEQRNFEAVLALMETGRLDPGALITHRFDFEDALAAYDLIGGDAESMGVVLQYTPESELSSPERTIQIVALPDAPSSARAAVIGAGSFAQRVLIPAIQKAGFQIRTIASVGGTSGVVAAERFGIAAATTDVDAAINDPGVDTVFVLTRHDTHAELVLKALRSGKNVFVEKPLALDRSDLLEIAAAARESNRLLMVGFNRRFAPLTQQLIRVTRARSGPMSLVITVNAGAVDAEHWVHDPELGGGRFAGEACHFVDLARAVVGAAIETASCAAGRRRDGPLLDDVAHATLSFADGSTAVIHYLATGARTFPKERIEAFVDGRTFAIENWRRLRSFGAPMDLPRLRRRQDKGHLAELVAWSNAVMKNTAAPIPLDELIEVSDWTLKLAQAARGGEGMEG